MLKERYEDCGTPKTVVVEISFFVTNIDLQKQQNYNNIIVDIKLTKTNNNNNNNNNINNND